MKPKSKILVIAGSDSSGGAGIQAVIAVIAYEPKAVIVLISAWIPAPPDESDPAITNILDFGFNLFNFF